MKAEVTIKFRDASDLKVTYNVGDVVEFDEVRARALAVRGLVTLLDNPVQCEAVAEETAADAADNADEQPTLEPEEDEQSEAEVKPKRKGRPSTKQA